MQPHLLDNPIRASLASLHAPLALRHGGLARFPADVAPFLAVGPGQDCTEESLAALVAPAEVVYLLGEPPRVPAGWVLEEAGQLAQMVCPNPVARIDGPAAIALEGRHVPDVLALAALVYPHYFRPRTTVLGRYFGIYLDGKLAAMIGERMGTDAWREISAVCTHPEFGGRGLARGLLAMLSNDVLARGRTPFLHVSLQNHRALDLYLKNGYHVRREIAFWSLRKPVPGA